MMKYSIGVINRFPSSGNYLLGERFNQLGVDVHRLELSRFSFIERSSSFTVLYENQPLNLGTLLWRLSENVFPAAEVLARKLSQDGHFLTNPYDALKVCADKITTQETLHKHNIAYVPAKPALPGSIIIPGMIAKPSQGAGGRSVLFGDTEPGEVRIPVDATEPWIVQSYVGEGKEFIRVLVVGNEIICGYKRIPAQGSLINNVDAGGSRVFINITDELKNLALSAAQACGTVIAGIDISPYPHRVLEVNGNPGLPPEFINATADALLPIMFK